MTVVTSVPTTFVGIVVLTNVIGTAVHINSLKFGQLIYKILLKFCLEGLIRCLVMIFWVCLHLRGHPHYWGHIHFSGYVYKPEFGSLQPNQADWNAIGPIFKELMRTGVPTTFLWTTVQTIVVGTTTKEIFVPPIIVGTVVPTMTVVTAVPTRIVGTAAKFVLFLQSVLEQLFPKQLLEQLF